jgi:hypothetical protein
VLIQAYQGRGIARATRIEPSININSVERLIFMNNAVTREEHGRCSTTDAG